MFKIKQIPLIIDDSDTISFIKYYMHNIVKKNVIWEFKYEEVISIA